MTRFKTSLKTHFFSLNEEQDKLSQKVLQNIIKDGSSAVSNVLLYYYSLDMAHVQSMYYKIIKVIKQMGNFSRIYQQNHVETF